MKRIFDFLKLTFVGGALIVLPLWLAVLLLLKVLLQIFGLVKPLSAELPSSLAHPHLIAIALIVVVCFLVGLAVHTVVGREVQRVVEATVLKRIPGYVMLSNVAKQMADVEHNHGFKPALVRTDEGLVPAFIVEELPDAKCTVFLPSAPTPLAGTIMIIDAVRVHPVDVSVPQAFACISKWGTGAGQMLAKIRLDIAPSEKPAQ